MCWGWGFFCIPILATPGIPPTAVQNKNWTWLYLLMAAVAVLVILAILVLLVYHRIKTNETRRAREKKVLPTGMSDM